MRTATHRNPALVAVDGAYVLLYCGGGWESAGYAVCRTPLGPCAKTTQRPILVGTGDESGTSGASVITGSGGDHWLAYHAWTTGAVGYHTGGVRSIHFVSPTWRANQLAVGRHG